MRHSRRATNFIPGTVEYFRELRNAYAMIRDMERLNRIADSSPTYFAGAWDDEYGDYEPIENIGPHERACQAELEVFGNPIAREILQFQRRYIDNLGYHDGEVG